MATDGPTPDPCNPEIFKKGEPIALLDASSNAVERWVQAVAVAADARLDWHYSAGVAQVLHLGDVDSRARAEAAITQLEATLEGSVLRRLSLGHPGIFRSGANGIRW